MYGMEPDRHGMVCCPFHSDSDPSMKLNDTYYYCFGCGANGDAIDLTAKLFDLNPRQAAEKLASDFGLDPDKPPANAIALPPPKRGLTDEQWADIAYCQMCIRDSLRCCTAQRVLKIFLTGSCSSMVLPSRKAVGV